MLLQAPEPDLDATPPTWRPPQGACDTHAHVIGPAERYFTVPDPAKKAARAGLEQYRRTLDHLGIDRTVLVQPDHHGFDNTALVDAIAALSGRARGVACLPPDAPDQAFQSLHTAGVRGVRVSNRSRYCAPLAALEAMAARVRDLGWHIGLLIDPDEMIGVLPRVDRLGVDIVIDHFGRCLAANGADHRGFRALVELARHPRCWVKLSAAEGLSLRPPDYRDLDPMAEALIAAGTERLLWGTDWPHGSVTFNHMPMPNDGALLGLVQRWLPDPAERRRVLAGNPARLYGFDSP
ncbi:MAG: hypothetical protein FJX56_11525 [Alphaproteobacteria bacterium]|nr:hypothetical protein [Alphaproteobacteria bacterium]